MALIEPLQPGLKVALDQIDPSFTAGLDKAAGREQLERLGVELDELQELMAAAATHSLLIILQGMDTSGKDGTIRSVLSYVDPQGCHVISFKPPTPLEQSHDFLWRIHQVTPPKGMIHVFNRSHYEDVLVPRVHQWIAPEVWQRRYDHINAFESLLVDNSTLVVKFFLHISHEEQEQRLLAREQEIEKAWKLNVSDWRDRQYWQEYQQAYVDVLERCNSTAAPWYIVPANKKWFRNIVVASALVQRLRGYRQSWLDTLAERSKQSIKELKEYRKRNGQE